MNTSRHLTLVVLSAALCSTPLLAAETVLTFEPSSTEIHWTLDTVLHTVHGTFKLKSGTITFDPATGRASGQLIVSTASGESGNESRDSRMNKSILESAKFPEIAFTADRVEGQVPVQGTAGIKVHGVFRLHGADHEMTLPVQVEIEPGKVTAKTKFSVPYIQWGLKNPSTFILRVDDKVDIDLHAAAHAVSHGGN